MRSTMIVSALFEENDQEDEGSNFDFLGKTEII